MAASAPQKPNYASKPWEIDPEAEMRRLLQSRGAPSDPKTVAYLLSHENSIDAFRAIVGGVHVPTTKAEATKVPTPESPLSFIGRRSRSGHYGSSGCGIAANATKDRSKRAAETVCPRKQSLGSHYPGRTRCGGTMASFDGGVGRERRSI